MRVYTFTHHTYTHKYTCTHTRKATDGCMYNWVNVMICGIHLNKVIFIRKHMEIFKSREIRPISGEVKRSLFKKVSDEDVPM